MTSPLSAAGPLAAHVRPGMRVAVADGAGAPWGLLAELTEVARRAGGVSLVLGWTLALPPGFDPSAFADVRTVMGGYALRPAVADGAVSYLPVRLGAVPSLLAGPLRPDVVVVAVRPGPSGWAWGAEVGWARAAVATGATVLAEVNHGLPAAARGPGLAWDGAHVVGEVDRPPVDLPSPGPDAVVDAVGRHVAGLVPEGAAVQVGPGGVGAATLRAIAHPVEVDSGVLVDDVVGLDERGLLAGTPVAAYLAGTERLYRWADGRGLLTGVEETHDPGRLATRPLVAVNTALEIDRAGQVNVETAGGRPVAGIGGHADYAGAASRSARGLSVIALPSARRGRPTLVDRLTVPASTPRCDVDVVVNEAGAVDLRGRSDGERAEALDDLWARARARALA